MNILASYDWLKEYVDLGAMSVEDFASRLSLSGPGVERLHPQGKEWNKIVLGRVLEVKPHPNADKLKLVILDVGAQHAAPLQIVCGGTNVTKDQWVAVALAGAMVRWHGEGELVELKPAEIRGVKSEGMICGANEIGLYDAFPHAEREILDLGLALPGLKMKPGAPIADLLGLSDDTVMDIEVTSNRVDAFSLVGLAREASAILKKPMTWKQARIPKTTKKLNVSVQEKSLCPRYMAVRVDDVHVGTSPWWLKRRLLSAGLRPINTLVDITNFVMLELGQPMHAFDANRMAGGKIVIRKAKAGEKMAALDGKTYDIKEGMLVIADTDRPQAVAGVMGSETSAVSGDTSSVIFEAATFDEVSVRKTARALNLYSDSQLRFEKGLSTEAPPDTLARAVELCLELCGGKVAALSDVQANKAKAKQYTITFAKIEELIGVPMKPKDCVDTLRRLGFAVKADAKKLTAVVPWWRDHDVESGRDLVEEIARVYGYANLPAVFPPGIANREPDRELLLEDRVRTIAKGAGLTETHSYSFVSRKMLEKAGFNPKMMLSVQNPLTADFEFMRTSLLPSLLEIVQENQERFRQQQIFEVQRVYLPTSEGWKALPEEALEMAAAILGNEDAWRSAKGFVEVLLNELGVQDVSWKRLTDDAFWHPGRSAQAWKGTHLLATIGELHPAIAQRYGYEGKLALVDMTLHEVFHTASEAKRYTPVPVFPQAKRDLAFVVRKDVEVQKLIEAMQKADELVRTVEWFDTYTGKGTEEGMKSLAFHLEIGAEDRTLESSEVDAVMKRVSSEVIGGFDASIRV